MPLIDNINGPTRRVYLHSDTMGADVHPIDIYKEMRTLRKNTESLRYYDLFMRADGNVAKTATTATERFVTLLDGTKIIPYDSSHVLTITGTIITDAGQSGVDCFDRSTLDPATVVDINYVPPQVEIITVAGGSGLSTEEHDKLLGIVDGLTTPQEVKLDNIPDSVWSESLSGYNTGAGKIQQLQVLDGFIRIDTVNGVAGTNFPIGTYRVPSNNLTDTLIICENNNIGKIRVRSDVTIEATHNISNKSFESRGIMGTDITFTDGCSADGASFRYLNLQGTLSGNCQLLVENCSVYNLENFTGIMQGVSFAQSSECSISQWAEIYNCRAGGELGNEPEINIGDSVLSIQQYRGNLKLTRKTADNRTVASFLPGNVIIDSTCVSGSIQILGIGEVEADNSGDNCKVDLDAVISRTSISESVWDEDLVKHLNDQSTGHALMHEAYDDTIFVDPINGTNGSIYPYGIRQHPVKNITDILAVSTNYNLSKIHVLGSLDINGEDVSGFTFLSDRSLGNIVTVSAGTITNETYFENLTVSGTMSGAVRYTTCVMGNINNFDGGAKNSLLIGNINITGAGANYLTDCDTYVTDATYKQINVGDKLLNIIRCRGNYEITNYTGFNVITTDLVAGHLKIASSCVSGIITVAGLVRLIDESGPGCNVIDASLTETGISDAVWNEQTSSHSTSGSFGLLNRQMAGLVHSNVYIDNPSYDSDNNLVGARVRVYSNAVSVGTANDIIGTYQITSTGSGPGKFLNWSQIKQ